MKTNYLARFMVWRVRHISNRNFILILSALVGIGAGLISLTLKTSVYYIRNNIVETLDVDTELFWIIFYPGIGIFLTAFMVKRIIRDNRKHSVAAILYAISKRNSLIKRHKIFSSMLGGIFTAGFGGSAGLEAPIISSGAALGSNLAKELHLSYKAITLLLACGASGAIAAIFNTPIAAIIFALEVLMIDLSRFSLIPLLVASSSGALTTKLLLNDSILLDFAKTENFSGGDIIFFVAFGVLTGFLALYFTKTFIYTEQLFNRIKGAYKKVFVGSLILGVLIYFFPALYGEGFLSIRSILADNHADVVFFSIFKEHRENFWIILIFFSLLALIKVVATSVTLAAGGIGGVFAPSLFVGGISGFLFAYVLNYTGLFELSVINFTLIGMAAMLAGVLHAPLTAIFLIAEISGGYELIVPLMICTTITSITVKSLQKESIFTHQLAKKGQIITHNKDKAVLTLMKLKSLIETDLVTIRDNASLRKLVDKVKISHRNIFPVLNEHNMLVGIILLDDIREIMFKPEHYDTVYVRELMHLPPTYITTDDDMTLIMKKFKNTSAWNLPVIENGKYLGFVSKSKMFEVYRKMLVDITAE